MSPPRLDQHLGLGEAVEDLAVEQFIPKLAIKALAVPVLPRRARRDVKRLHADLSEPFLDLGGDELAAIIRPDMGWRPSCDEQVSERRQHVLMLELARHDEREALPAGLVDDGEDAELTPIMGAPLDEVVRPDVSRIFRPKPDAGSVVKP